MDLVGRESYVEGSMLKMVTGEKLPFLHLQVTFLAQNITLPTFLDLKRMELIPRTLMPFLYETLDLSRDAPASPQVGLRGHRRRAKPALSRPPVRASRRSGLLIP